ncbi:MAG: CDP-alcohol phosphatidyltransferase family protein [Candidatus Palauibacterales bacterium]|nr:CDP-alcohol phosphatidyltransferase family protein [Candidatus Palauibacterales bacterium]
MNLPNTITVVRIALAPLVPLLMFQESALLRLAAFGVFTVAALSDLWDGYLARSRGETTDFGKVADPIADKLLLAVVLVPVWWITTRHAGLGGLPLFGGVPLWVVVVLLGREVLITGVRVFAARRGVVLAAAQVGKHKAFTQSLFLGGGIMWVAYRTAVLEEGWTGGFWAFWDRFHAWWVVTFLVVSVLLTVYSMIVYLLSFRSEWPFADEAGAGREEDRTAEETVS